MRAPQTFQPDRSTPLPVRRDNGFVREPLAADTSPEVEQRQILFWRGLSPADKAALITAASLTAERLALAGIHARHPHASDRELFLRLAVLKLGLERAIEVYPDAAALDDIR
jgi:hypothetical protein